MAAIKNPTYSLDDNPDDLICIRNFLHNLGKKADKYRYGENLIKDEISNNYHKDYQAFPKKGK